MVEMASQITSLAIVYSIVYSDADQRKHQSSTSLAFVRGIHRGPVNSSHKWPVTRKMFPFDDVIMWRWGSHTHMILIGPTIERYGYEAEFVIGITLVNNQTTSVTMFVITSDLQTLQPLNQNARRLAYIYIYIYTFDRLTIQYHSYSGGFVIAIYVDQQRWPTFWGLTTVTTNVHDLVGFIVHIIHMKHDFDVLRMVDT